MKIQVRNVKTVLLAPLSATQCWWLYFANNSSGDNELHFRRLELVPDGTARKIFMISWFFINFWMLFFITPSLQIIVEAEELYFNVKKLDIVRVTQPQMQAQDPHLYLTNNKGLSNVNNMYFIFYISCFVKISITSLCLNLLYFVLLLSDFVHKCNCPLLLSPQNLHLNMDN